MRKYLADISYRSHVIAHFVLNLVAVAFHWPYLMAQPRQPPYRRKNLADISYVSRVIAHFVPYFVAMATREGRG